MKVLILILVLASCQMEKIVVRLPECTTSSKTVDEICDAAEHIGGGQSAAPSWNSILYDRKEFANLHSTPVHIPNDGRKYRICQQYDICGVQSLSENYAKAVDETPGFFVSDKMMTKIVAFIKSLIYQGEKVWAEIVERVKTLEPGMVVAYHVRKKDLEFEGYISYKFFDEIALVVKCDGCDYTKRLTPEGEVYYFTKQRLELA